MIKKERVNGFQKPSSVKSFSSLHYPYRRYNGVTIKTGSVINLDHGMLSPGEFLRKSLDTPGAFHDDYRDGIFILSIVLII